MNAIRIRKHLDSHVLDLPELEPLVGKNVEIIVLEESSKPAAQGAEQPPIEPGSAAGLVVMAPDFDEPLEDFEPYMK